MPVIETKRQSPRVYGEHRRQARVVRLLRRQPDKVDAVSSAGRQSSLSSSGGRSSMTIRPSTPAALASSRNRRLHDRIGPAHHISGVVRLGFAEVREDVAQITLGQRRLRCRAKPEGRLPQLPGRRPSDRRKGIANSIRSWFCFWQGFSRASEVSRGSGSLPITKGHKCGVAIAAVLQNRCRDGSMAVCYTDAARHGNQTKWPRARPRRLAATR